MRKGAREDRVQVAGLVFGLLFFPSVQLATRPFLQEGIITFWVAEALGIERIEAGDAAEPAAERVPEPDRTRPLAVMIDNHPDARPQSGVAVADVVWEVPVEGGLTRNMLVFRSAEAAEVGPVRSARPYFLRWAREFDAIYAHVGGSDEALRELASEALGLDDANEFRYGSSFRRDGRRSAPHNTYTSTEALRALALKNGWATSTDAVDATARGPFSGVGTPAAKATVTYIRNGETAEFRWDASASAWTLWRGGRQAFDRDGAPVMPRTVVVLAVDVVPIADPQGKGLIGLASIGTGKATVLRDGAAIHGTWKKTSAADPTRVTGEDGAQIPFAEGQVWYAVVAANRGGGVALGDQK